MIDFGIMFFGFAIGICFGLCLAGEMIDQDKRNQRKKRKHQGEL